MRKFIITIFFAALCSSLFAQGRIFDATFLTFSAPVPIMKWGKLEGNTSGDNLKRFYKDEYNARHFGLAMESGTTFYMHKTEFVDGFKMAIVWDFFDLGMNMFRYDDQIINIAGTTRANNGDTVKCLDLFVNYSMNVGLMFTVSPIQDLCIDLYGKYRPTVGINYFNQLFYEGSFDKIFVNDDTEGKNKLKQENMRIGGSVGTFSVGLNFRYSFAMAGIEYIVGKLHYAASDYLPRQTMYNQMIRFKLGFVFTDKY
ncbi:MAG: hypothetical protein LBU90_07400 [Bacteroidales bacterium]|nr:hypothetical protein [Bacteroidales bacterium]